MFGVISVDTISNSALPTLAGFFFCLASAEGAGLLFLPGGVQATYKRLRHVLCSPCSYTTHAAKQRTGLYRGISVNLTHSKAHNTAATQAEYIPPARRWSVSQHRSTSSVYQIPTPRRTLHSLAQPPIIIRYIRVQGCATVVDPCRTVPHIADHASPAGQSSDQGAEGGAEPLTATAVSLFGLSPDNQ